jgi:hypothetical protein
MILEEQSLIMYLESIPISLVLTIMMKILEWAGIQTMMIKRGKKYGSGGYQMKE